MEMNEILGMIDANRRQKKGYNKVDRQGQTKVLRGL